ncbi:UNKNOWN [Stylonychia lemnae]|uniref:Uncharacterized protein n=1 Tax=Stylonychia lemnae TaxID=5949 RepID=A0A078AAM1_STYLE|nr:UNKNOWN [Stylonychia lemnae]|eukprot:CDW78886.1 UNKNOWN [Stylonychia lemnae]
MGACSTCMKNLTQPSKDTLEAPPLSKVQRAKYSQRNNQEQYPFSQFSINQDDSQSITEEINNQIPNKKKQCDQSIQQQYTKEFDLINDDTGKVEVNQKRIKESISGLNIEEQKVLLSYLQTLLSNEGNQNNHQEQQDCKNQEYKESYHIVEEPFNDE